MLELIMGHRVLFVVSRVDNDGCLASWWQHLLHLWVLSLWLRDLLHGWLLHLWLSDPLILSSPLLSYLFSESILSIFDFLSCLGQLGPRDGLGLGRLAFLVILDFLIF